MSDQALLEVLIKDLTDEADRLQADWADILLPRWKTHLDAGRVAMADAAYAEMHETLDRICEIDTELIGLSKRRDNPTSTRTD